MLHILLKSGCRINEGLRLFEGENFKQQGKGWLFGCPKSEAKTHIDYGWEKDSDLRYTLRVLKLKAKPFKAQNLDIFRTYYNKVLDINGVDRIHTFKSIRKR
jgi:hypothetical protein